MCTDRLYNVTCMLSICVGFILRDIERGGGLKQYADILGGKTVNYTHWSGANYFQDAKNGDFVLLRRQTQILHTQTLHINCGNDFIVQILSQHIHSYFRIVRRLYTKAYHS